jgi:hypothetical protein
MDTAVNKPVAAGSAYFEQGHRGDTLAEWQLPQVVARFGKRSVEPLKGRQLSSEIVVYHHSKLEYEFVDGQHYKTPSLLFTATSQSLVEKRMVPNGGTVTCLTLPIGTWVYDTTWHLTRRDRVGQEEFREVIVPNANWVYTGDSKFTLHSQWAQEESQKIYLPPADIGKRYKEGMPTFGNYPAKLQEDLEDIYGDDAGGSAAAGGQNRPPTQNLVF